MNDYRANHRGRAAFSLVEMLAVVVLLSLVTTAGLWSVAGASESARVREAVSLLREGDALARLMARRGRAVELRVEGAVLLVVCAEGVLSERSIPRGVEIELRGAEGDRELEDGVAIDCAGRSDDYGAVVRGKSSITVLDVAGLTGLIEARVAGSEGEVAR